MSKAYSDLNMNANNIINAVNITVATEIRANTNFNHAGANGITQFVGIVDDAGDSHNFTFTQGILTNYAVKGEGH